MTALLFHMTGITPEAVNSTTMLHVNLFQNATTETLHFKKSFNALAIRTDMHTLQHGTNSM